MTLKLMAAAALVALAVFFGVSSFKKSMTPYLAFDEARHASGLVQVNGVLADKNYVLRPGDQYLEFKLKDAHGEVLPVEYRGVIPGNFDQATSIVAIGSYQEGRFKAQQLLVKCPSKYQAEAEKQRRGAAS